MKLHDELKILELNSRNALLQKDDLITDLNSEINMKNHTVCLFVLLCYQNRLIQLIILLKIGKQLEQIDQMTIDLLSFKGKFDEQEKELHKFKMQLEQNEYDAKSRLSMVNSQLIDREDYLNRLQDEVNLYCLF